MKFSHYLRECMQSLVPPPAVTLDALNQIPVLVGRVSNRFGLVVVDLEDGRWASDLNITYHAVIPQQIGTDPLVFQPHLWATVSGAGLVPRERQLDVPWKNDLFALLGVKAVECPLPQLHPPADAADGKQGRCSGAAD